ncbi:MAG: acyl carrier protein [Pseudohongiella sp.]|uniref:acyl carrier protein n=1 Tax=Pseudohongiella sp. TaxID=1979412 RepID=UPI0034A09E8E
MTDCKLDVWHQVSHKIFRAQGGEGTPPLIPAERALAEMGLDSLKLIEIVYELETFYQLDVDEELLAELENIEDLIMMFTSALAARDGAGKQKC